VDTGVRKLILATASVLVIGIGGTDMSHAADLGKTAPNPSWNTPANSGSSQHPQAAANLSKDDIREAQLELRHSGLYNGSLDGVIGPQTKQALVRFQKDNGLEQTATLDALTMVGMFGNIGTSEGSSMPRNAGEDIGSEAAADSRFAEIFLASALSNQDPDAFSSCTVVIERFDRLERYP
jgi:peptidoglycan hydrolase-like protein with peptidoglycan-binding domain